ncbi:DUF3127 domain-containing protein [Prosthecochloris sp. SCSIO W1103]|uniref:DUF3127 domain-containing protein n=1 Tax=Prosthecochloris sp. SCSIO W1103 TaxID=2992244 RepID=UPI00223DFDDF|nr:DUF3127 domain-containing protein [Prosthecochloris sp. SCSIO W1103]UZJ37168.1 DUF3127 domain-containing protein [Prosthecochloris sp. SCSIO W1103]
MDITGTIIEVLLPKTGEGKNGKWKKQEVILETDEQYPKKICFSFWGEKAENPLFRNGTAVKISFDLESREFNGRWYTDAKGWRVEPAGGASPQPSDEESVYYDQTNSPEGSDDLPF